MRNVFIMLATFLLVIFSMQSQQTQFGVKGGLNISNLTGDTYGLNSKTAFHFGVLAEIPLSDILAIQPELLFAAQGSKADSDQLKLNYFNIPVMAKYYATNEISIEVGPQFGFLLTANSEIDDEGDIKDDLNQFDFGINFGIGFKADKGLNLGFRYNLGLANVYNDLLDYFSEDDFKAHNSVFQLFVAYMF
ncbi:PorT family protein [Seonamhaeicola sp. MEBiC1930]|uniref:porin family protein n=1 Tax=Seonamhaeicola sp. MEBiC01930 TaxID=2976768 RepID=UPI003243178C